MRGPFVTDPSASTTQQTQRWFHVVLTLEVNPADGRFTGTNHLDIAVSQTAEPDSGLDHLPAAGAGRRHRRHAGPRLPADNDGTGHGPCLGDYPHIGADANGFYITTNEYAFFPRVVFIGAQIYAFSKAALAANASSVTVTQLDTVARRFGGKPGFTLWPAQSPPGQFATRQRRHGILHVAPTRREEASATPGPCRPERARRPTCWSGRLTNTRRSTRRRRLEPQPEHAHRRAVRHPAEVRPEAGRLPARAVL